jgi:hypothetical protein
MPQFILPALSMGTSVLGSALSGRKGARTSTSTPTYSPEMKALQDRLLNYSGSLMDSPDGGTGPMKLAAVNRTNQNYANMPGKVSRQLAGRGFGKSGKMGTAMYDIEGSRMNELSGLESAFAQMGLDQRNRGASIGQMLLSQGTGTESTGPGSPMGNALMSAGNGFDNLASMQSFERGMANGTGNGMSSVATMLMLSKILGGGK